MTAPQAGEVLAGKFKIERVLGEGGMGVVVLATHLHLDQKVAIKFLLPEAVQNEDSLRRFIQEARAAARIQSEHVARVFDVGTLDNGAPYLVMEYLQGQDLASLLQQRGPLPIDEVADYVLQACEAIAEAHVAGIIHRDLKPANLFLTQRADGSNLVKVLDFGISKLMPKDAAAEAAMTKTRALMGSPSYMSPEQMRSTRNVSPRSDIWALGIIIYELLTQSLPFAGETMTEICARVLDDPLPSVRARRADLPVEIEAVVRRCTEKRSEARYGTVADLAEALAPFAPAHSAVSVRRIARIMRGAKPVDGAVSQPLSGSSTPSPDPKPVSVISGDLTAPLSVQDMHAATQATFGGTAPKILGKGRGPIAAAALGGAILLAVAVFAFSPRKAVDPVTVLATPPPPPSVSVVYAPPGTGVAPTVSTVPGTETRPDAGTLTVSIKKPGHAGSSSKPGTGTPKPVNTAGFGHGVE